MHRRSPLDFIFAWPPQHIFSNDRKGWSRSSKCSGCRDFAWQFVEQECWGCEEVCLLCMHALHEHRERRTFADDETWVTRQPTWQWGVKDRKLISDAQEVFIRFYFIFHIYLLGRPNILEDIFIFPMTRRDGQEIQSAAVHVEVAKRLFACFACMFCMNIGREGPLQMKKLELLVSRLDNGE